MNPTDGIIVRHLVNEAGRAFGAVHLCGAKVFLAQRLQVRGPQFPDRFGVVHAIGTIEIERTRHVAHVGQFGGSLDLTVTGQDLLDQRGAGTGQTHHEYGCGIEMALAAVLGQKFLIEHLDHPVMGRTSALTGS